MIHGHHEILYERVRHHRGTLTRKEDSWLPLTNVKKMKRSGLMLIETTLKLNSIGLNDDLFNRELIHGSISTLVQSIVNR